jgi:RNA polymerase sigma-70 factor, ECF subfamily
MNPATRQDAEVFSFGRRDRRPDQPDAAPDADALLTAAGRGDERAFTEFYDAMIDRVFGLVRSVLRDPARSEEVTQEVMLELWRTAPRFAADRGSAITWSLTVAHRRAVDRVRSEVASRDREQRVAVRDHVPDGPDVADSVEDQLDRERVQRALVELTDAQRQSIELAYFRGFSHREVAAALDLPLGTVKTRIRDGMIRLRDRLEVTP